MIAFVFYVALTSIVLSGIALALLSFYIKYHFRYWERRRIPRIDPTESIQQWMRTTHYVEIFSKIYEMYKHKHLVFAGFYFNMQKAVVALDLPFVAQVLEHNFDSFQSRGLFHNERNDPLTGNLFLLDGPKWKPLRSKLMPTFTAWKMRYIFPTLLKVGNELQTAFKNQIAESGNGVFEITYIVNRFSCDVIGNCVFGLDCQSMKDPNIEFFFMARKFFCERRHPAIVESLINCFPAWAKFLRMKIIPQSVTDFYIKTVKDTIANRERCRRKTIKNRDYLDVLMELEKNSAKNREPITKEELTAQAFSFFINGFDTCSATISCALYELARHQHIQNKLRQEINKTLKAHKKILTYECLNEMKYLDQVVSETLRKYPAYPALLRKCTKSFEPIPTTYSYYEIEKGCMVIIPILSLHYDEKYFPNPLNFDPRRFSAENATKIKPYSYLPFGEGQRACIGMRFGRMQINVALLKLIQNLKFEICSETEDSLKFVIPTFNLCPISVKLKVTKV